MALEQAQTTMKSPRRTAAGGIFTEIKPPLAPATARTEAARCLECGGPYAPAPCLVACPAEVPVPQFVAAIARGNDAEAAHQIFSTNLLGGTCARVCATEMLCEGACVLNHEGRRPVEIGRLQRFATDYAFAQGLAVRPDPPAKREAEIAVIGAGPAGLVAAGELTQLGYQVTVFDGRDEPGGLVRYAIAPYRQNVEPIPTEFEYIRRMGVRFDFKTPIATKAQVEELEQAYAAIFLGVGMGKDVDANFGNDDLPGVWDSLPFIEALKVGPPPKIGKHVVVIGGGNTAIDVAREAVRLGALEVTILYRRTQAEMPAFPLEIQEARGEGIHFQWLTQPVRFLGKDKLNGIECRYMKLGEPDTSGRRRPAPVEGTEFIYPADTAVKAIGQQPRIDLFNLIEELSLQGSVVKVNPQTMQTDNPRYFAGGDAVNGGGTVVEAVRMAKLAAKGIDAWLKGDGGR